MNIIGDIYRGFDDKVYLIESEDQCGYNIRDINDPSNARNISVLAIGRTFHRVRNFDPVRKEYEGRK